MSLWDLQLKFFKHGASSKLGFIDRFESWLLNSLVNRDWITTLDFAAITIWVFVLWWIYSERVRSVGLGRCIRVVLSPDVSPLLCHLLPIVLDLSALFLDISDKTRHLWRWIGELPKLITRRRSALAAAESWPSLVDRVEFIVIVSVHYYLLWAEVVWNCSRQVRPVLDLWSRINCVELPVELGVSSKCCSLR